MNRRTRNARKFGIMFARKPKNLLMRRNVSDLLTNRRKKSTGN